MRKRAFAVPITLLMAVSATPVRVRAANDDPPAEVLEHLEFFQNMGILETENFSDKAPAPSPTVRPVPSVTPAPIRRRKETPR